jgi:anaerobic selenocysteine-containing dehydrogenase
MHELKEGDMVWVEQADGGQRAGIFVGEAPGSWFGGAPGVYVVYPETHQGEEVAAMRVVPREG